MVEDLTRARNRLGKFLLRHGRVWRGGSAWTHKHEAWLGGQRFDEPALGTTDAHDRAVVATRHAQLDAVEADLATWLDRPPFADQVARLAADRGVTRLGGRTWPPRWATGAGSLERPSSWGSAAWSQANTPAGTRSTAVG